MPCKLHSKSTFPFRMQRPELIDESETQLEVRKRLPTVGVRDSQETVDPTSSNSEEGANNGMFTTALH